MLTGTVDSTLGARFVFISAPDEERTSEDKR